MARPARDAPEADPRPRRPRRRGRRRRRPRRQALRARPRELAPTCAPGRRRADARARMWAPARGDGLGALAVVDVAGVVLGGAVAVGVGPLPARRGPGEPSGFTPPLRSG